MSRYTSFSFFMRDVVRVANDYCDLNKLFEISDLEVISIVLKLIMAGWSVFLSACVILSFGGISFAAFLLGFLATPPGMIVGMVLGVGAAISLRKLYKNRKLPIAIKEVGSRFKPRYEALRREEKQETRFQLEVDELLRYAVMDLIGEAKVLSREQRNDLVRLISIGQLKLEDIEH